MKKNKKYHGIVVPSVTPLTSDYKLDEGALEKVFENFYHNDVVPFVLGTTGESASLPLQFKKAYIKKAVSLKKKGTFLYAGISSTCFSDSIDLAKFCFDNGVDAVAATLPYYYQLTEDQMRKYFTNLVETIKAPLIVYNIPVTT